MYRFNLLTGRASTIKTLTIKTSTIKKKVVLPSIILTLLGYTAPPNLFADCTSTVPSNTSLEQYRVNTDDTVTDLTTMLVWQRCPAGYQWNNAQMNCDEQGGAKQLFTWQEALNYAATFSDQVNTTWRLPNIKELESLIKRNCHRPAIESFIFSNLHLENHWTSTSAVGTSAWAVNFQEGGIITTDKQSTFTIRLVRDETN